MEICNDNQSGITNLSDCFGEWNSTPFSNNWNVLAPRVAANPYYNFDDFGSSLFILFQIVSQEGWIDVMWSAESITGRGLNPRYFASQGNGMFFVIFNLLGTVFVLTLFISVFMRNYTEQTGVAFLTSDQRSWLELRKLLKQVSPSKRPSNTGRKKWRDWCYKRAVRKHGRWQRTMTIVLVLHLILLIVEYYPEPAWWETTRTYIFLGFTVFYMVNIAVRIIGLSWSRFSRSSWDIFSIFAVLGSFIFTILHLAKPAEESLVRLQKTFLVLIVLLVIPRNDALDQLFKTAAASLPNIGNLLATWFVLFIVYAIALTQTLGLTRFGSQETGNLNFRDVPKALILLFRISTGEGWNQIMEDFAVINPPLCVEDENFFNSDCGSLSWARALFISWNILSMYIFTSLFVSLIYESFSYVYQHSSGLGKVSREEIRRFKQAWATLDPEGTGFITKEQFPRLLGELSGVFEMRIYKQENSIRRILEDIQSEPTGRRITSMSSASGASGVDLQALNQRLSKINPEEVRKAKDRHNLFFEEVMVSADVDRGISFTTVLMTLAHYNVISDNKSLK
jgi:voltage-dependent calcium channel